jgi:hypothetical protein
LQPRLHHGSSRLPASERLMVEVAYDVAELARVNCSGERRDARVCARRKHCRGGRRYQGRRVGNALEGYARGAVAQLGEHHTGSVGVRGSSPLSSTTAHVDDADQSGWYHGWHVSPFVPFGRRASLLLTRGVSPGHFPPIGVLQESGDGRAQ